MRVHVLLYFGGLLSRNSKEEMNGDCFVSSCKLFHTIIVDGKKEL